MTRRPALFVTGIALASTFAAAQVTIAVKTEEVRIDVLVTDHGKPVRGLKAEDFEVFDEGEPQKIEFASFEEIPIDAVMALDMSASVAGEELNQLRVAGTSLLESLKKEDRAALVTFSNILTLGSTLSPDIASVKSALDRSRPSGSTSLIDASYAGLTIAESSEGRPLVIIFSDGLDTSSWLDGATVLDMSKRGHAVVYGVSVGMLPNVTFLRDLCKFTGGSLFEVELTRDLRTVFLNILEEFRQRYLVCYVPTGTAQKGWHRLEVRVKRRNVVVKARPGYLSGQ